MERVSKGKVFLSFALVPLLAASMVPVSMSSAVAYASGEGKASEIAFAEEVNDARQEAQEARAGVVLDGNDSMDGATQGADFSSGEKPVAGEFAGESGNGGESIASASSQTGESPDSGFPIAPEDAAALIAAADNAAETAVDNADASLDPAHLSDGTYTVSVKLVNASDVNQPSMAASAIDAVDKLSVKDGVYTLGLSLSTVQMGSITGYVSQIDAFASFALDGAKLQTTGEATPVWTAKSQGDPGPAAFPVPEATKGHGYAALQLHSAEMPVSPQKAGLFVDWSTLQKESDGQTQFDDDASGAQPAQESQTADGQQGEGQTDSAAQEPTAPVTNAKFQTGHVYSVPIYITKTGTTETSMAAKYFGGTANVRPLSGNQFDVRITTNNTEYITSLSCNGAQASVTHDDGSTREYSFRMEWSESDVTAPITFVVAPMGGASVSADLHLYFSRATDLGSDTGQVAASQGGGAALPSTGDPLLPASAAFTGSALLAAAAVAVSRRKAACPAGER